MESPYLSPIERLPTEVIQEIFRWSRNFNLALSSPYIAFKLSNQSMYNVACDYAFDITSFRRPAQQSASQQELFSRRWMTWDFFKQYLCRDTYPNACPCWLTLLGYQCDGSWCRTGATLPSSLSCRAGPARNLTGIKNINCPLPTKLTRGPFTPDKIRLLAFLLKATNMSIDRADKEAIRIATRGRREAIRDRNYDAVWLFGRSRRLGNAVTLDLIKFAVIDCDCDRTIVFDLMVAAKGSRWSRWNDLELDAWVARKEAAGNPKGKWLKKKLEELRSGQWPDLETANYEAFDILRVCPITLRLVSRYSQADV